MHVCVGHTKTGAKQPWLHAEGTAESPLLAPEGCVNRGQGLSSVPRGKLGFAV